MEPRALDPGSRRLSPCRGRRLLFRPLLRHRAGRPRRRRGHHPLRRGLPQHRPPSSGLGHAISPGEKRTCRSEVDRRLGRRSAGSRQWQAGKHPRMILYPAIDIRGGRCVRLIEGDFDRETAYDSDPSLAARRWVEAGAEWVHVVDLDGAVAGRPINGKAVVQIRAAVDVPIQLGGGLRLLTDLEKAFSAGVNRVILGTAVLRDPELVINAVARWGERIAVALDTRDGRLATDGWLGQSDRRAVEVAQRLAGSGVRHFVYTDIRRDGTLSGPDLPGLSELVEKVDVDVTASGGIASLVDIKAVATAGAAGVIIGRALYDGRIDLAEAVALFGRSEAPCCVSTQPPVATVSPTPGHTAGSFPVWT